MPTDTTWDDVWAEYDARAGHTPQPNRRTPWYLEPGYGVPLEKPRATAPRRPRYGLAGLVILLVTLLGVPMGEVGAPAVATSMENLMPERHNMIVFGAAGDAEMGESPALPPPPQVLAEVAPKAAIPANLALPAAEAPRPAARASRQGHRQPVSKFQQREQTAQGEIAPGRQGRASREAAGAQRAAGLAYAPLRGAG